MNFVNPNACVPHFASCLFKRLEEVDYGEIYTENSDKTTELLCKRLAPAKLQFIVNMTLEYEKALKTYVKAFSWQYTVKLLSAKRIMRWQNQTETALLRLALFQMSLLLQEHLNYLRSGHAQAVSTRHV